MVALLYQGCQLVTYQRLGLISTDKIRQLATKIVIRSVIDWLYLSCVIHCSCSHMMTTFNFYIHTIVCSLTRAVCISL